MGEGGGGEDAVKWNVLVSSVVFERCERAPFACTSKQHFGGREVVGVVMRSLRPFDGSFDSLNLSCRGPQRAKPCTPFCQGLPSTNSDLTRTWPPVGGSP